MSLAYIDQYFCKAIYLVPVDEF